MNNIADSAGPAGPGATYPTSTPTRAKPPDESVSEAEIRLIRRLRTLRSGIHLCIIHADGNGVFGLTLMDSGKLERLRRPEPSDS